MRSHSDCTRPRHKGDGGISDFINDKVKIIGCVYITLCMTVTISEIEYVVRVIFILAYEKNDQIMVIKILNEMANSRSLSNHSNVKRPPVLRS